MSLITGFFHRGVTVSDVDSSLSFYHDAVGLELAFDTVADGPYLPGRPGTHFTESAPRTCISLAADSWNCWSTTASSGSLLLLDRATSAAATFAHTSTASTNSLSGPWRVATALVARRR